MTRDRRLSLRFAVLRRSRAAIVAFALLGLLFAQTALAFYRCPQLSSPPHAQATMPCDQMDMTSPALCKAFVQGDTQGLDGPRAALDLDNPGLAGSVVRVLAVPFAARPVPSERFAPPRARPPPLWIWLGRFRD